jgi:microcompartment protein CcmL/EutN
MEPALAVYEIDGMPTALVAQDAALKRAPVRVSACAPTSPGKVVLVFHGDVASVVEARAAVDEVLGSRALDHLYLPGVAPAVLDALGGREITSPGAAGLLEFSSVASLLLAADAAVKSARVQIARIHAAAGYGGRGYLVLRGPQAEVEAALDAAAGLAGDKMLDRALLPRPHDDLAASSFRRPWPLDPAW